MEEKIISIIIPAYNEGERIGETLKQFSEFFLKKKIGKEIESFEILVVLNACKDNTLQIVEEYQRKYGWIKFLDFKQGGKGFAITEGFRNALKRKNNLIGFVDADLATSPPAFYDLIKNIGRYDGAIASRGIKGAKVKFTFIRKITHRGFNFVVRCFFLLPYHDTQCGAKIFRREIISEINELINMTEWAYDVNLLYLCKREGFKLKEVPTVWEDKKGSKVSVIRTTLQMFLGVLRLRLIYSIFDPLLRPVKFILKIGDKLVNKK